MALTDDVRDLGARSLAALDQSHDYHTYTKRAWRLMSQVVQGGRQFNFRNSATGTTVGERELVRRSRVYVAQYLTPATFQHFVSLFEDFFFDLLRLWLAAYPASLGKRQVDFETVLRAPDKATLVLAVVDRELNELKNQRVADWFTYLEKVARLGCPTQAEVERLAEIKASRDILVHNKGLVNATYLGKAGALARYREGETLEIPTPYHRQSWDAIRKLVQDLSAAAERKARRGCTGTGELPMTQPDPANVPDVVAKVGGSLLDVPDLRDRLRRWLAGLGTGRVLLVPGGGAFADVVRQLDKTHALGGAASHWLALKTVDLNGEVLNCLLGQPPKVARAEELARFWAAKAVPILGIIPFALVDKDRPDTLPASWTVSSDSIAARVAVVTGARRLVLLKSTDLPPGTGWEEAGRLGYVDGYFATAVRQRPGLAVEWVNLRA
jgi:aspartokinase-like uncharacterized kinase